MKKCPLDEQGRKPTLHSVAELALGIKTAGILHRPFPPVDNTQKDQVVANLLLQQTIRIKRKSTGQSPVRILVLALVFGDNSEVASNDTYLSA